MVPIIIIIILNGLPLKGPNIQPKYFNPLMHNCQNGQTHFKNLAAFASVSDHFGTFYINTLGQGGG